MEIRDFAFQPAHFTEGKGLELRPQVKCAGFRTRQVCAKCNSGWMSSLEGWAKTKIGSAVAPGFTLKRMTELVLADGEIDLMIRWLLKTAIIFELAAPRGDIQAVNPKLFPVAAGKEPITDSNVWAGYIAEPNFLLQLRRGFPVWNGGKLEPYQIHKASVDFGLQLNHLAIRLIRCPDATAGLKLGYHITNGVEEIKCVPLILPIAAKFEFPHTYLFPSFYAFLDTLEVHVKPPSSATADRREMLSEVRMSAYPPASMMDAKHDKGDAKAANGVEAARALGLSHGDEYRLLRDEIMQRMKDIHQTELFGAIGVGLVYSWFILHRKEISSPILWFIGPCVVALCAVSCLVNVFEIWRIGRYLARIEEVAFAQDEELMGWEREQRRPGVHRRYVIAHFALSFIIWVLAFGATIWASWILSRP